jgi:hypothetical protein
MVVSIPSTLLLQFKIYAGRHESTIHTARDAKFERSVSHDVRVLDGPFATILLKTGASILYLTNCKTEKL